MIYFKQDLKDVAMELIKARDNVDLLNDISEISNKISALESYPALEAVLFSAQELDNWMQVKYPIIQNLLNAGNKLANVFNMPPHQYSSEADRLKEYLKQDVYGILCHTLIKEHIIKTVDEFIDS